MPSAMRGPLRRWAGLEGLHRTSLPATQIESQKRFTVVG